MDERTLNDLLECSVCLERLDTSSKVLPCQHTFCRKCLEVIVSSHQELRCPECRILVDIKIEDLPPNVLLMRILEGMKNSTQNQNNITKSPLTVTANTNSKSNVTGLNNVELNDISKLITNDPPSSQAAHEQNISNRRIVPHAFALHDFISKKTGDLNFKKSDIILLKRKLDINWFVGELNGREGAIPVNYVQVIVPLPVPQCMALYDFKMGPNEEEGCLTFKKGTLINVLRRVDHNWAEGCIGSCIGIFPIAFVEMNALAKQLLESGGIPTYIARVLPQIPFDNNSSDSSSTVTTSPNSTCSSNTSSNSVPSSPTSNSNSNSPQNSAVVKQRDIKEKRHSLNSLTPNTNLSVVQSNRHSAEILSVPDPVDQTNASVPTISIEDQNSIINTRTHDSPSQQTSRANVLKTNIHHNAPNLPWAYVALYPYKPRKSDELELKKGCVYFVTERCLDGWYKGKNWADKSGVFPGNYVTPLRNRDQQQLIHQRKTTHNMPNSHKIITSPAQPINTHDNSNTAVHPMPPPELPPRSNTAASSSVWTKPLGHHVEAFLNKKFSSNSPRNVDNKSTATPNNITTSKNHANSISSVSKEARSTEINAQQSVTKERDKKEQSSSSAVSLMKRLTNMKRSKSPTNSNQITYLMDNPVFEDIVTSPLMSSAKHNASISHPVHVRSGSCPSQLLQSLPIDMGCASTSAGDHSNAAYGSGSQRIKGHKDRPSLQGLRPQIDTNRVRNHLDNTSNTIINCVPANLTNKSNSVSVQHKSVQSQQTNPSIISNNLIHHRKSQSLDANTISSQITNSSLNSAGGKPHGVHPRESSSRFRCIVSYPPNSDVELELNVGDIVFVHKKQKNGWYKGTHARTIKTGLFPASFVEPDI